MKSNISININEIELNNKLVELIGSILVFVLYKSRFSVYKIQKKSCFG